MLYLKPKHNVLQLSYEDYYIMLGDINIVKYSPSWKLIFQDEQKILVQALDDNDVMVYHIGSTSLPELSAKPIIDILVVVRSVEKVDYKKLEGIGYNIKGEFGMPFRIFGQKKSPHSFHLHIWEKDNPEIDKHLMFRDFLRHNEYYRNKYANLKNELAKNQNLNMAAYIEGKDSIIKEIIQKSGFKGFTIVEVLLPAEEEYFNNIKPTKLQSQTTDIIRFVMYAGGELIGAAIVSVSKILWLQTENYKQEEYLQMFLHKWIKRKYKN